jgi:hypothetical protein
MSFFTPELRPFKGEIRADWSDDQLLEWTLQTAAALGWEDEAAPRTPFDLFIAARMHRTLLELTRWPRAFFKMVLTEDGVVSPYRNLCTYAACYDVLTATEPANGN